MKSKGSEKADIIAGTKLFLQDPAYGDNEINFVTRAGPPGPVDVTNDPNAFNLIDEETILFSIGNHSSFWYPIEKGPMPTAIITDHLETCEKGGPILKPQENLLKKYKAQEIAPKGTEGLGVHCATKFWTSCN